MKQAELLDDVAAKEPGVFDLGKGYTLRLPKGPRGKGLVYCHGGLLKTVELHNKAERRLLVVELIEKGVNQTRLAEALKVSRQSLHNYRESYRLFGLEGVRIPAIVTTDSVSS